MGGGGGEAAPGAATVPGALRATGSRGGGDGDPRTRRRRGARRRTRGGFGGGGFGGGRGGGGGRGNSAVWVLRADGSLERVAVRVGITDGSVTEVVSGDLKEGDKVVTEMIGGAATAANRNTRPGLRPHVLARTSMVDFTDVSLVALKALQRNLMRSILTALGSSSAWPR
jgi:hypothetical protein